MVQIRTTSNSKLLHIIPSQFGTWTNQSFPWQSPLQQAWPYIRTQIWPNLEVTTDCADELLKRTQILYDKTNKNVKKLLWQKQQASPLKKDYC